MQHWQRVWRVGLARQLSKEGLERLRAALVRDDPQVVQGETMFPPALEVFAGEQVECACAVGYCLWKGKGAGTIGTLTRAFEQACARADARLGEAGACRLFFDWFDSVPRRQMRQELLQEIDRLLNKRAAA